MGYKDFYAILGVSKTESLAGIKKAYRKLAMKYHPDKNPDNKAAEEKFKEINEAYSIVGDEEKRKSYDDQGTNWGNEQQAYSQNQGGNYRARSQRNNDGNHNGGQFNDADYSDFFAQMFGGNNARTKNERSNAQKGQDYTTEIHLTLKEAYEGTSRQIQLENQTLKISIKPGVMEAQVLRLRGKGAKGINGGADGDVFLTIRIADDLHFLRKNDDLYCDVKVDLYVAILGGKTIIQTLNKEMNITIDKETENGKVLRLKKMGMPKFNSTNEFGDLYAKVQIIIPKNISDKETALFKELQIMKSNQFA